MCQRENEIRTIKQYLNENIKLISLSFNGVKADEKLINIADILKHHSRINLLPEIQKFKFYDFENVREQYMVANITDEEIRNNIERINRLEKAFLCFKNFLASMRDKKKLIEDTYICGTFHGFKVIYTRNLRYIDTIRTEIENEKLNIDTNALREAIVEFINNFNYIIRSEMSMYDMEESSELQSEIQRKFEFIDDVNNYIDKIKLEYNLITDISDEILRNRTLTTELRNLKLNNNDKEIIDRYYTLSCISS